MAKLTALYKRQQFQPRWYSIWLNPFFIIRSALFRSIREFAPRVGTGRLLDFGCGAKPYRNLFRVTEYIGVDMENPGHPHLTEDVDVFYDGRTLPFPDASFDALLCSEVIEHVFEPDDTLREIARVLKPGAMGIFSTPFVWNEHEMPFDYGRYSAFGLRHLLEKHGFEVIETTRTTHFFQTWLQLGILYVYELLDTGNKYANLLLTALFIAPLNLVSLPLAFLAPRKRSLYHNVVMLVRKRS